MRRKPNPQPPHPRPCPDYAHGCTPAPLRLASQAPRPTPPVSHALLIGSADIEPDNDHSGTLTAVSIDGLFFLSVRRSAHSRTRRQGECYSGVQQRSPPAHQAHMTINYDLPWNPNCVERRLGRIRCAAKTEVYGRRNIVSVGTTDAAVHSRLFLNIDALHQTFGQWSYDMLGRLFDALPLDELLMVTARYGQPPSSVCSTSKTTPATSCISSQPARIGPVWWSGSLNFHSETDSSRYFSISAALGEVFARVFLDLRQKKHCPLGVDKDSQGDRRKDPSGSDGVAKIT